MKLIEFSESVFLQFIDEFIPINYNAEDICDGMTVKYFLRNHVGKYFIGYSEEDDYTQFFHLWNSFFQNYKKMLFDCYDTLKLEYNPLENVNGTTEYTHGKHTDIDTNKISSHVGNSSTESHPYGFNSSNYSNSEKVITNSKTDNYTDSYEHLKEGYTDKEIRHGNLGVTTSQSMVNDEIKLRQYNLFKWFFELFVNDNLFYC